MFRVVRLFAGAAAASVLSLSAFAQATVTIPPDVTIPEFEPWVRKCADPAADRFLEIDLAQKPPAGATKAGRIHAWVTPDGMFHWPFVMRLRNLGEFPFVGNPGGQVLVLTEDDLKSGKKGRKILEVPFERIDARSGLAARFEFTAPAADVQAKRFHRVYRLSIKYLKMDKSIERGAYGDCNFTNNEFAVEIDGSRKGWIFEKK